MVDLSAGLSGVENLRTFIGAMQEYDPTLLSHSLGVTNIAWQLASYLKVENGFQVLLQGALLHDIGKTLIDRAILQKPGPLSPAEQEIMKRHPVDGAQMLAEKGFSKELQVVVLYHHERWDGKGYLGLAGNDMPLNAQIVALADAIDAMSSDRPYREALPPLAVYDEIEKGAGSQFSSELVGRLAQAGFWPTDGLGKERVLHLINRERQWLNFLAEQFHSLRHPLVQIQNRRLDKLVTAYYGE
ncbi:MAG: HD domain-containing protein [Clostridia bacterium]|nr:MAG: HD domain-containing protein [Clostridia bacterium]